MSNLVKMPESDITNLERQISQYYNSKKGNNASISKSDLYDTLIKNGVMKYVAMVITGKDVSFEERCENILRELGISSSLNADGYKYIKETLEFMYESKNKIRIGDAYNHVAQLYNKNYNQIVKTMQNTARKASNSLYKKMISAIFKEYDKLYSNDSIGISLFIITISNALKVS